MLPETVGVISVVGNPCMQQLFLGIMPENLAKIPFAPVLTKAEVGEAGDIFPCCPHAALVTVPDISGYVGRIRWGAFWLPASTGRRSVHCWWTSAPTGRWFWGTGNG